MNSESGEIPAVRSMGLLCPEPNPRELTVPKNEARSAVPITLTHLDLFSGIGGFALAARWVGGIETVAFCEREPFAQRVLRKHWPAVPICDDIHHLNGTEYGPIDLITGGFPCQPYSLAGERRGNEDDRALWPQMLRVIRAARPAWVLGENVPGIISMALDGVLADLEAEGYACETLCIPACGVDARHRRDRVWIVAYNQGVGRGTGREGRPHSGGARKLKQSLPALADANGSRSYAGPQAGIHRREAGRGTRHVEPQRFCRWEPEPSVGRVAHGIPARVDRLRGLGNAIVPQVAAEILSRIMEIETAQAGRVGSAERRAGHRDASSAQGGASGHNIQMRDRDENAARNKTNL